MTTTLDELDRLAAEKVMGWEWSTEPGPGNNPGDKILPYYKSEDGLEIMAYDWQPTRNIAQAWELLEKTEHLFALGKMYENGISKSIYRVELYGRYGGEINPRHATTASTASEAIVRVCLAAKGVEI